jgi:hypothetical protein
MVTLMLLLLRMMRQLQHWESRHRRLERTLVVAHETPEIVPNADKGWMCLLLAVGLS